MFSHTCHDYYFAYGSDLWPPQMQARCPGATRGGPATLADARVSFIQWHTGCGGARVSTYLIRTESDHE